MALLPDDVLDNKYRIIRLLGEGGMGAVYEGLNTRIQRRVAIKVLHGNVASNQDAVQRFEREAQAAGRIGSKHIVQVLDLGDLPGGERYMVMEFLDGVDLTQRIRSHGQMSPRELYPIAVQVLEGLIAAHDAGIIHRDLKPDNIFIVPEGEAADFVKILDFGISKFNVQGGEFSMTQTGIVMGTPYYMSPEQARGSRDLDHRTDLYSLGVILYEALAGRVPHNAETFNELIIKIVLEDAPPLKPPKNDEEAAFQHIVQKAISRDAKDRYQSAADFQAELHDWATTFRVPLSTIVKHRSNFPPGHTRAIGTQRAWVSNTEFGAPAATIAGAPRSSSSRKLLALSGLLAVLVVGAALAIALSRPSPEPSPGLTPSIPTATSSEAPRTPEPPEEASKEPQKTTDPKEVKAPQEPPAPEAAEPAKGQEPSSVPAKATVKSTTKAPTQTPAKTTATQSPPKAAEPAPTKSSPEPAKPSTTSTGRTIRSTL